MSVSFTAGTRDDEDNFHRVRAQSERLDEFVGFNLNNGNAVAFLRLLELPPEPYGEVSIVTMVRAVQKAKASFDQRAAVVTRAPEEGGGNGKAWYFIAGADVSYFARRFGEFSELLADWIELGAETVIWG
jgi:hypothetical protein